jgi:predicted PilT family ATPase
MEILKEDSQLIKVRLQEIKKELRVLADEFHRVLNQGSETWHDNAPWDEAKGREAILLAEQEELQRVLNTHSVAKTSKNSPVGKEHTVKFNGKNVKIFLAGDYSVRAGQKINGHIVVTKDSPIAKELLKP